MAINNTFEGGTNGSTILTTDTPAAGDTAPTAVSNTTFTAAISQYTNANKMHGSLAYRGAARGTSEAVHFSYQNGSSASTWYSRFYFMYDSLTSTTNIAQFRIGGSSIGAYIGIDTSNHIQLRNGADTTASAGTYTMSTSTWYRLETAFTASTSTTAGTLVYKLFAGDGTTALEDNSSGTPANAVIQQAAFASGWNYTRIGPAMNPSTNQPSTTGYLYIDDVQVFATTWPGPTSAGGTFLRPISDISLGDWAPTPTSPTTLFDKLDETAADDADYITGTTTVEVKLG